MYFMLKELGTLGENFTQAQCNKEINREWVAKLCAWSYWEGVWRWPDQAQFFSHYLYNKIMFSVKTLFTALKHSLHVFTSIQVFKAVFSFFLTWPIPRNEFYPYWLTKLHRDFKANSNSPSFSKTCPENFAWG